MPAQAALRSAPHAARAHELGKTRDWVVLFHDGDGTGRACTVITATFGPPQGRHIVRGREAECSRFYQGARSFSSALKT